MALDGYEIEYVDYDNERYMADIQALVSRDLSEPYSIFTYRYFLHNWPKLCVCAFANGSKNEREMIGTIICKADNENGECMKGYVAMLTVNSAYRNRGIGIHEDAY